MSRVLIADDHAVVRAGFKQFLEADASINAVGEAASGNETLDLLREQDWDLVLLDIHMPDRSGLDILRHIQTGHPGVRVLVMSGLPEQQYAVNVLRAGASGYLSKDSAPEELMKAVRTVLAGRRYVSAALAEILVADLDGDPDKPLHARLSTREFQIFCKLAAGRGVSDIANELSLSVKTVSTYRSRILEKMSFTANAEVEDSKVLTERLTEAIRQIPQVELIGTADTEATAVASAQRDSIDVIILDLHLKQGTGFGVMRALATAHLKPRIIVLTNYDLPEYKNAAIALGASHFLDKARDYGRLPEVLHEICEAHLAKH